MTDQLYRKARQADPPTGVVRVMAVAPVEIDYEAMETYLHATIYTARREEAMLDRDAIKWIVAQLIVCGVGGDLAGLVWRSFDG